MKKAMCLSALCFFALTLIFSSCAGNSSEVLASTDKLLINDIQVDSREKFDAPHLDKAGNMIMPLEFICQMQGFEYSQSSDGSSATVKLDDKTVTVTKGSDKITTSSGEADMAVKTTLKKGTLYVPAEPVLTALGYKYKISSDENGNVAEATGSRGTAKYETMQKQENFDTDPGVYGERNIDDVSKHDIVTQDFGYKNYNGENVIGGNFQRSLIKGYYAIDLPKELTLNDNITFSGKYLVPKNDGSSDVLFGLFSKESQDYRPNNYMCMRLDGDAPNKYFVYFENGTKNGERYRYIGNFFDYEDGKFIKVEYQDSRADQPGDPDDRLKASETEWHTFSVSYDPNGDNGNGTITGVLDGFTYSYNLQNEDDPRTFGAKGFGAALDQFGVMTQMNSGVQHMQAYFKDLTLNGQPIPDLSPNGGWKGVNNVLNNQPALYGKSLNVFGYNTGSDINTSKPGQFGGIVWRLDENRWTTPSYAGMSTGFLDLTQPLHAAGKFKVMGVCKDSDFFLGWFNSTTPGPDKAYLRKFPGPRNSIGCNVSGQNMYRNQLNTTYAPNFGESVFEETDKQPYIYPQTIYDFTIDYTPNNDGTGTLICTLNGVTQATVTVPKEMVDTSVFDSFGVVSIIRGGMYIKFAIDDIEYTVRK